MKSVCSVVIGLAILVLMASNVLAQKEFPPNFPPDLDTHFLYCTCLDTSDLTALNLERAICDTEAEELYYRHGVLLPQNVHDPQAGEDCGECEAGVFYDCFGAGLTMPPISPRVN